MKCLPSFIIKDYSIKNYKPEVLDVGYEKILLDGTGELIDRYVVRKKKTLLNQIFLSSVNLHKVPELILVLFSYVNDF